MTWTREYDALIARVAEGWEYRDGQPDTCNGHGYWVDSVGDMRGISHYLTDLAAIARAQEAWRLQDADNREYTVTVSRHGILCRMFDVLTCYGFPAATEAAARAWATWRACGGVE
ncbi:MAG: hypothetical protein EBR82_22500 [Caulobacteraceae bacterium]|nr:hypothetical protein [Caulobacteraceae bacterium]